jgi:hypothetical protein
LEELGILDYNMFFSQMLFAGLPAALMVSGAAAQSGAWQQCM